MTKEKLEELKRNIELMRKLTNEDAAIAIFDETITAVAFFPAEKFSFQFEIGYQARKTDPIGQVIETGKKSYSKVPKEVFGTAIEGKIEPIIEDGKVIGAITYSFSTEAQEEIESNLQLIQSSLENTAEVTERVKKCTTDLIDHLEEVRKVTEQVEKEAMEATSVVATIQKNASYSNILALNASIESVRAGQAGNGFAVVAKEMGKFSKMSGDSADKINGSLKNIVEAIAEVSKAVQSSTEEVQNQINMIGEIAEKNLDVVKISELISTLTK